MIEWEREKGRQNKVKCLLADLAGRRRRQQQTRRKIALWYYQLVRITTHTLTTAAPVQQLLKFPLSHTHSCLGFICCCWCWLPPLFVASVEVCSVFYCSASASDAVAVSVSRLLSSSSSSSSSSQHACREIVRSAAAAAVSSPRFFFPFLLWWSMQRLSVSICLCRCGLSFHLFVVVVVILNIANKDWVWQLLHREGRGGVEIERKVEGSILFHCYSFCPLLLLF